MVFAQATSDTPPTLGKTAAALAPRPVRTEGASHDDSDGPDGETDRQADRRTPVALFVFDERF